MLFSSLLECVIFKTEMIPKYFLQPQPGLYRLWCLYLQRARAHSNKAEEKEDLF